MKKITTIFLLSLVGIFILLTLILPTKKPQVSLPTDSVDQVVEEESMVIPVTDPSPKVTDETSTTELPKTTPTVAVIPVVTTPVKPPVVETLVVETPTEETPTQVVLNSAEVAKHNSATDCYLIVKNNVYDVTSYIPKHPAGKSKITNTCGEEVTNIFASIHSNFAWNLLGKTTLDHLLPR